MKLFVLAALIAVSYGLKCHVCMESSINDPAINSLIDSAGWLHSFFTTDRMLFDIKTNRRAPALGICNQTLIEKRVDHVITRSSPTDPARGHCLAADVSRTCGEGYDTCFETQYR